MLKLIIAAVLFLLSLLVIVKAPLNILWLTAVAVTNYPLIFIVVSAVSGFFGKTGRFSVATTILNSLAFILFLLPIVNAFIQSQTLSKQITKIFSVNNESELAAPFNFFKMFRFSKNDSFETLVYKQTPGVKLTFDFYKNTAGKKAPLVIVIHGGSWQSGDSRQLPELNTYLSHRGYNIASINYRLAPAYRSPAPVEDTKDVIDYILANAEKLNIDTTNIFLLGRSAGGQIALTAAYSLHLPCIKGVISYYGPADMVWGGQIKMNKLVLNTDKIYDDYFGGQYEQVPQKFKEASSIEYVTAQTVPTLIIHGRNDPLVSFNHGIRLQKKLNSVGVANYFLQLSFATHGCDFNINGPDGQLCTYATEVFLQSVSTAAWKN